MKANKIAFERRYSDDSGVEFGVRLADDIIEFECVNTVQFPAEELDWLLAALLRIKDERGGALRYPHDDMGTPT